jgi:hypothetical protein
MISQKLCKLKIPHSLNSSISSEKARLPLEGSLSLWVCLQPFSLS